MKIANEVRMLKYSPYEKRHYVHGETHDVTLAIPATIPNEHWPHRDVLYRRTENLKRTRSNLSGFAPRRFVECWDTESLLLRELNIVEGRGG